jgi:hypothetical protein
VRYAINRKRRAVGTHNPPPVFLEPSLGEEEITRPIRRLPLPPVIPTVTVVELSDGVPVEAWDSEENTDVHHAPR